MEASKQDEVPISEHEDSNEKNKQSEKVAELATEKSDADSSNNIKSEVTEPEETVQKAKKGGLARIKSEFIDVDHKPKIASEYLPDSAVCEVEAVADSKRKQSDNDWFKPGQPPSKKIKLKGRNKHRPREQRVPFSEQLCSSVIKDVECRFKDRCKYSHDIKKFMESKPPDLGEKCYVFEKYGKCPYGFTCRFASKHLSEDSKNTVKEEIWAESQKQQHISNSLGKELQGKLWKNKYNFVKANDVWKMVKEGQVPVKENPNADENKVVQPERPKTPVGELKTATMLGKLDGFITGKVPGQGDKEVSTSSQETCENSSLNVDNIQPAAGQSTNVDVSPVDVGKVCSASTAGEDGSGEHGVQATPASDESAGTISSAGTGIILTKEKLGSVDRTSSDLTIDNSTSNSDNIGQNVTNTSVDSMEVDSKSSLLDCKTFDGPVQLRPEEKKVLDFSDKLYLAPLTTVGNLPFRRICKQYGADITCGEMALCSKLLQGQQSEWALVKRHASEDIFGVQLCGTHPENMIKCSQLLSETIEMDFVDINCGCPIDMIFKRGEGSALMGRNLKLSQVVQGMKAVVDVPVTVKMRTGIYEDKYLAHKLVPKLRDMGVALTTIHGRSREQRYTRLADWDYINQCSLAAKPMPIFGNGDILSYEDANLRRETTGVSGVMIARGALMKPWIFTEIKEQRHWDISSGERLDMLKDYTNWGLEHWGSDTRGVGTTRRFLLEWLSFLYRYIPVGILEHVPQKINEKPPYYFGRNDLETMMASPNCADWVKISEMLLGPVPDGFTFLPKHKANSYQ